MRKNQSAEVPDFSDEDKGFTYPMPIYVTKTNLRSILRENNVEKLSDLDVNTTKSERYESLPPK